MPPQDRQPTRSICLSGFGGIHEERLFFFKAVFIFSASLSLPADPGSLNRRLVPAEDDAGLE